MKLAENNVSRFARKKQIGTEGTFSNWFVNDAIISITGVLAAYKGCISRIQLYGPTNFAPTILHVANIARQYTDGSQYFILLIITDGIITDMPQTKKVKKTSNIEYSEF